MLKKAKLIHSYPVAPIPKTKAAPTALVTDDTYIDLEERLIYVRTRLFVPSHQHSLSFEKIPTQAASPWLCFHTQMPSASPAMTNSSNI